MSFVGNLIVEMVDGIYLLNESKTTRVTPKKISRVIAAVMATDPFIYALYSKHTLWQEVPGKGTAGVAPHHNNKDIIFVYDPVWLEGLKSSEILFVLIHEIGHIVREHHARSAAMKQRGIKVNHKLMNICMDTWINEDIKNGNSGRFTATPPFECYSFTDGNKYGSTVTWVNNTIEEETGVNPGVKYTGPDSTEPFYEWMIKAFKDNNVDLFKPKGPKPGDIIHHKGQYGRVITVDDKNGKVTSVEELTKDEAFERVRIRDGAMKPKE